MIDGAPRAVPPPEPSIVPVEECVSVRVRPLAPTDEDTLKYGIEHLSTESSYNRFLAVRKGASEAELHYLTHPDQVRHLALGAEVVGLEGGSASGVGVARSVFLPGSGDMAEYAVAVTDDFQGLGIGTLLLKNLSDWAQRTGVHRWLGVQLATNTAILKATSRVATEVERRTLSDGVVEVVWQLRPGDEAHPGAETSTPDPRG